MKLSTIIFLIISGIIVISAVIYLIRAIILHRKAEKLRKINVRKAFDKMYLDSIKKEAEYLGKF